MKRLKNISILVLALILITPFAGCKKYDEGPAFSLRTKKARVANEWKIDHAFEISSGAVTTQDYFNETWEFTKEGEFFERKNGVIDKSGTWDFISDKEAIQVNKVGANSKIFTILKLKNKEMWLRDSDEEYHLVPVN